MTPVPAAAAVAVEPPDRSLEDLIELLERDLRRAGERLSEAGSEIRSAAEGSARGVEGIGADSRVMVGETARAKADAEAIAGAMQDFSAASAAMGRQAGESTRLVTAADTAAGDATARIDELKKAIGDIQTVVSLIAEIAGQTNLLALNATIEAARAGAAGRGFAIVAQEVKALSQETQKATAEIGARIGRLHEVAEQSIGAVNRVIGVIGEIRPAAIAVAKAVEGQEGAIREVADTATHNARFAESVRERALAIEEATRSAMQVGAAVGASTGHMQQTVETMTRQLVTVLRQTPAGDRRRHDRWPVEIRGAFGARRVAVKTIDLSLGGALLAPDPAIRRGETGRLELSGLGPIEARVVETSSLGHHLAFLSDGQADLEQRVAVVAEDFRPLIERAQAGAAAIGAALEGARRRGELDARSLFDHHYRPIPGTDPQQFEASNLAVLERLLPPIQEPILAADNRLTFAAAVDLNAWLPVHNQKYSHPQRRGDPVWNAANCRNRRIFDDRAGLLAARNTRPFLVQSYARDLGGGNVVVMKEVDAPIRVDGRHWGGFRTAYRF